jgi:hypothetical protein
MAREREQSNVDFSLFINKPEIAERSPAVIRKLEEISYQAIRRLDEIERGQAIAKIKLAGKRYRG